MDVLWAVRGPGIDVFLIQEELSEVAFLEVERREELSVEEGLGALDGRPTVLSHTGLLDAEELCIVDNFIGLAARELEEGTLCGV